MVRDTVTSRSGSGSTSSTSGKSRREQVSSSGRGDQASGEDGSAFKSQTNGESAPLLW